MPITIAPELLPSLTRLLSQIAATYNREGHSVDIQAWKSGNEGIVVVWINGVPHEVIREPMTRFGFVDFMNVVDRWIIGKLYPES